MDEDQIDQKLLEGEQAGTQMGEQQETEDDPLKAELDAAEKPEEKPEEGTGTETPAAEEEKPALGQQDAQVSGAFAQMKRAHAVEVSTLQAQIQAGKVAPQQAAPAAPPEKSPRQVYIAENPEAEFFPPSVEVAQDEWKEQQSAKAVETTRQSTELQTVTTSMEAAYAAITDETHGAGLQTLHSLGAHLLTPNDNARIYMAGPEAGEQMHSILTKRVKDAGLYPQSSSAEKPTPKGGGPNPPAPKQEQQQTQSEEPELEPNVAQITKDVFRQ